MPATRRQLGRLAKAAQPFTQTARVAEPKKTSRRVPKTRRMFAEADSQACAETLENAAGTKIRLLRPKHVHDIPAVG